MLFVSMLARSRTLLWVLNVPMEHLCLSSVGGVSGDRRCIQYTFCISDQASYDQNASGDRWELRYAIVFVVVM